STPVAAASAITSSTVAVPSEYVVWMWSTHETSVGTKPDATLGPMSRRRLAVAAPALLVVIAAAVWFPHSPAGLRDLVLAAGAAAPLAALAAWALLTPALFPGTVLAGASGLAFGAAEGIAVALIGAVLGGLVAFALARTAGREPALGLARRSPKVARL